MSLNGENLMTLRITLLWLAMGIALPAAADDPVIEEIVVTATKRAKSVQDIPVAVNAVDESTI